MTFPSTVKAITFNRLGEIDVIEQTEIRFPEHAPGDIIVKVQTGGVNFSDAYIRAGTTVVAAMPFPAILGNESAGVIVALPTDGTVLSNDEYKRRGFEVGGKVVTFHRGSFAEYISIPWHAALPVPDSVSSATAAAALVQGLTAVTFMREAYDVKKGDTVLIHTVAGGLGLLFAQYAKLRGATVIGTTSTKEKAEFAKKHGADHVILYKDEDTARRVLEITGGKGVEAVFDGVGKDTFDISLKSLKRKGTFVVVGMASGKVPPVDPVRLLEKNNKFIFPLVFNYTVEPEETRVYAAELFDLISQGTLKINIFKHYPFTAEGAQQAQLDLIAGKTFGKLVMDISSP